MSELRKSGEDYLEAILVLKNEKGIVRSIDVAHYLEFSKPSVSRAVSNLKQGGYLVMEHDGELTLTEDGLRVAENILERHTILTALFTALGVSKSVAAEDACRIEHVISEETFERIKALYSSDSLKELRTQEEEKDAKDAKKKKKKKKKN